MHTKLAAALAVGAVTAALATTGPASARPAPPELTPVAEGLLGPLSLAVGHHGSVYVTQNFAGRLDRVGRDGALATIYTSPDGSEVGGVSTHGRSVTFTTTGAKQMVLQRDPHGHIRALADLGAFEQTSNPDGRVHYGIKDLDKSCAEQFPAEVPSSYTGIVESHPYATLTRHDVTYVADAAGNAILRVDRRGHVRTVAVLPPQPTVITAEAAEANGVPSCAVGKTYRFEAVPTDVEAGPDGWLYVSTLPGGPEDPSMGARGAVYKVNPRTGRTVRVAGGFLGATNLAVSARGDILVTELFGNRISVVKKGSHRARTWVNTTMPGAVEVTPRHVYVTTSVLVGAEPGSDPGGLIVKARLNSIRCLR